VPGESLEREVPRMSVVLSEWYSTEVVGEGSGMPVQVTKTTVLDYCHPRETRGG
jgi:hypothetical protein